MSGRSRLLGIVMSLLLGLLCADQVGWLISWVTHPWLRPSRAVYQAVREECLPFTGDLPDSTTTEALIDEIGPHSLVLVGEASHQTTTYPAIVARLATALAGRRSLDAVILEASTTGCRLLSAALDSLPVPEAVSRYLPYLAGNSGYEALFTLIQDSRAGGHPIALIGCDPTTFRWWVPESPLPLLAAAVRDRDPALAESLLTRGPTYEAIMRRLYRHHVQGPSPRIAEITAFFRKVVAVLDSAAVGSDASSRRSLREERLVAHAVLGECLISREKHFVALRDSLMAAAVMIQCEGTNRTGTVLLYAHDGHVMKALSRCRRTWLDRFIHRFAPLSEPYFKESMGERLAGRPGLDLYVLGMFSWRERRSHFRYPLLLRLPPIPGELREVLLPDGLAGAFVDLTHVRSAALANWAAGEQYLSALGPSEVWLRPAEQFDGLIVIRETVAQNKGRR